MDVKVRTPGDDDYAQMVDVSNRSYPEYGETEEEWRFWDTRRSPKMKFGRLVAETEGRIVGVASYEQWEGMYHPRKFSLEVMVDPESRRQGIGGALYDALWRALEPFDPIGLRCRAREDYGDAVRFAAARGYVEVMRAWESRLDLQSFDSAPYADHLANVEAGGIRAASIDELAGDPQRDRKLWEMVESVAQDVPSPDPHTPVDFDLWRERNMANPNLLPRLYLVAVDGERFVGLSNMWASKHLPQDTWTGLTGTIREYRRRGIALALKVRCIQRAREMGYVETRTWNETGNEGMLSINVRLGFVRQPAWVTYAKDIGSE